MSGITTDSIFGNIDIGKNISDYQNSVTKGLNGYSGDIVKAISPIQNKLKEGTALVKSTESKVGSVITGYRDSVIGTLNSIVGSLSGGLINFSDAAKYVKIGSNGVSFDTQGLTAQLGSKIGLDLNSNSSLMYQLTNMANSEFNDLTGGVFGNLVTSDGSSFRITQNWRDQAGNGLLSLLGRTTSLTGIMDDTFNTSYYNSLLKLSAQYGMSDSYESIMKNYTDQEDAQTAVINIIPTLMQNGDLVSMGKVLDLVSTTRYAVINAKYPQLINQLFNNFSIDQNTSVGEYPTIKALFFKVITTIFGNNWYLRKTAFGDVLDLGLVNQVSDDIKKVLVSDATYPEIIPLLCSAGIFNSEDAITVFERNFPDAPILTEA